MLDNYRDLIDELLGTPSTLRALVADRGDQGVPAEAATLLTELRDRDLAVLQRLQTMTRQRDPYLRAIASPVPAPAEDAAVVLQGFESARGEVVSLLMNLTLRDWERSAIDETEGELTLSEEVERHVEFDEAHLARLQQLLGQ
jgi:hypothetical protein